MKVRRRYLIRSAPALTLALTLGGVALASEGQHHRMPALTDRPKTSVTVAGNTVTVSFGPIDLPAGHQGDLAASMPKHIFEMPKDMFLIGFKAAIFTKDGAPLPREYLHHILLINLEKESFACPGELYFFAGAGLEMTEARFPAGYGVKLAKGQKLMAVAAFYHKVPPTKDAMATFTMEIAPEGVPVQPLEAYHVGINVGCYTKLAERAPDETDEGISLQPGLQVRTAPIKFRTEGCVKFAYPHGHDQLVLFTLENKSGRRTLLRTVPDAARDGTFLGFPSQHVYTDSVGFPINPRDEYEISMIYQRPLHDEGPRYAMANYLLYLTPGACSPDSAARTWKR